MPGHYAVEQQSGTGGRELEADRASLGHMQAIAAWSLVDVISTCVMWNKRGPRKDLMDGHW